MLLYKYTLRDVVGLKSRGCRKLKTVGGTIETQEKKMGFPGKYPGK